MQTLAVVLVRLIDTAGQILRQRIDGCHIVNVAPLDEARDGGPIIDELRAAEGLEEIHHSRVRFVFAEDRDRHRARSMQM